MILGEFFVFLFWEEGKEVYLGIVECIVLFVVFYYMIYGIGLLLCCYKILVLNLFMLLRVYL